MGGPDSHNQNKKGEEQAGEGGQEGEDGH